MAHPALALRRGQADCQSLTFCTLLAIPQSVVTRLVARALQWCSLSERL